MDPKIETQHNEEIKESGVVTPESSQEAVDFDQHAEKKLIRKVDRRLLPILGALYSIALIDRVNISAARISGMDQALGLSIGDRYTIALVLFFPGYMIFELPSNIVLRKVGAANWLAFIALAWGTVMLGQGFVKDYRALAACRFLLGVFEAGFFPGCVYLISVWYVRFEVQQRLAWFYLVSVFVGGWSSILAYGLIQMEGLGGLGGWQWIFVIEGLLTQVVAIGAWFIIVDFPDKATRRGKIGQKPLLTEEESRFITRRIEKDRGDSIPDPLTWAKFFHHLGDWKLWAFGLMFMSTAMPAYALAYFSPVIVRGMGYSVGVTHLLSAPPVIFAVISALFISWLSDKYKVRAPGIAFQCCLAIGGLMMTAYCEKNIPRYIGLFFGYAGCQGNIPSILAYQSNNIRMQSKRAVGSALQIGLGGLGGILGSTVFRQKDAPRYVPGLWITAGLQFFILGILSCTTLYFSIMNRRVDAGTIKKAIEGQPGFKYTL
ncbi:uncharacterized protein PV09_06953 [Verruconis gallopava]|uniref:Major facilitator superfamily (MFS) profile domain-containing protein n=1 Tax=Verruconis gallopava TaxID=253628 RepID=A0A0D1XHR0_9PEZI|nr:uncharacterized protein PV09_06953 [Verruconis gallopava]KIW01781.1 hypothetical protein PV09_06953 [Verruconis gallopava]